jgi:MFS family permease
MFVTLFVGYAIITFVFSDDREKYIGMAEAIAGVGLMIGPVIGAFLYSAFGYFFTFFVFGLMLFLNLLVTYWVTPDFLNQNTL